METDQSLKNTTQANEMIEENGFDDGVEVEMDTLEFNNEIDFEKATVENV